jgi:tetratricopeptide (TPR) repeat protein
MKASPPIDPPFSILEEPEICPECNSGSRLANGLCLNCLLRGALDDDPSPTGKDAFKEVLAAVKSRDGDWSIGEHEIIDEIARGGMGVIYRARDPHSGRIVALKCILAYQGDSDQAQARFRREAETAARLDHPNIIPIFHVGETADGSPFFTMKYATNGSLLQARDALSEEPRQSVLLMAKVAQAVQYAHEQGVLHRDLKPGNILLDARREPLVSDFGLARCEEIASHFTRSLTSFGTPGYIAPEQAEGPAAQLTAAADIYSLGAILFELLAGRLPFLGDNVFGVMKQSAEKPAPKLRTLAPHLDRDLETICARCLERDPSARYRSAGSLAQDLLNWLEGRPIIARPVGLWLRSHRWVKSNRRLAAVLAALVVLAAVSVGWRIHGQKLQAAMQESLLASRSIAVVPFLDLDNPLADPIPLQTLATSLQDKLNPLGPARVTIELGSPLTWVTTGEIRKTGKPTKARAVLTGTFRAVQGKRRISFRLVDPASGESLFTHLSEENEQEDPAKLITEELGRAIYAILAANDWSELIHSRTDPALRNDVARRAMTAARLISHSTVADCDHAIALFRKALQAEPNSSLAHSYLAMEVTGRTHYDPDRSFLELGRKEAEIALRLSPGSSYPHRALAGVLYQEGKFSAAYDEGLRAIEIGGLQDRAALFLGMTSDMLGRPHQALQWYKVGSQLAVSPGDGDASIGDCWAKLVDDGQAEQAYNRATELRPHSFEGTIGLAHLRLLQGKIEAAREICRAVHASHGETDDIAAQIEFFARNFEAAKELYANLEKARPDGGGSFYGAVTYRSAAGRALQALGKNEQARVLLADCLAKERAIADREPENPEAVYRVAAVEASLGMLETSVSHLRKAVTLGWADYRSLDLDPRFDLLRPVPEFQTIMDELSAKIADMRTKTQTKKIEAIR